MVYLKLYESFNEINAICRLYNIENYTINNDGSIDVDDDVDLSNKGLLRKLPLSFSKVSGYFNCSYNELTSLGGCPSKVGGYFNCSYNELTSLGGCPIEVGSNFNCSYNYLTSLEGCPREVGNSFHCNSNYLTSLEGCPREIGGYFYCGDNPVYEVYKLIEKIVVKDYFNLIEFVENWNPIRNGNIIILDRLNDYLETFGGEPVTDVKGYKCI